MYTKILLELGYRVDALCLEGEEVRAEFPDDIASKTLRIIQPRLTISQRILLRVIRIVTSIFPSIFGKDDRLISRWWMVKTATLTPESSESLFVFILDLQGHLGEMNPEIQKLMLPSAWAGLSICPPPIDLLLEGKLEYLIINSPSCNALCSIDEARLAELEQRVPSLPLVHLPDISYTRCSPIVPAIVSDLLARANGHKIVLLASLTKKHGLIEFLRLTTFMSASPILFCAIGLVNLDGYTKDEVVEVATFLKSPSENLFILPDFYPEEEILNSIFELADAAYLCYKDFNYSSNKLTKSIFLSTPVLVTHNTLLADRVQKYRLGYAVDPDDLHQTAIALNSLIYEFYFDIPLHKEFMDYYSEQTIGQKLAALIN